MSGSPAPGLCVIYRFRLKPGAEQRFIEAWSAVTIGLRDERGGLGSRLHRGPEGIWYAYAQWPSAEARREAFAGAPVSPDASAMMRDAIEEQLPEIVLDPVVDLLVLPSS